VWEIVHSEVTDALPAHLWTHYTDLAKWPTWDRVLASVTIEGPVAVGGRGRVSARNGTRSRYVVTELDPLFAFTTVHRLPLARLTFTRQIEQLVFGSRITHRATITGFAAGLYAHFLGPTLARSVPAATQALARLAEIGAAGSHRSNSSDQNS
jgi:Polyketide cyclase / dehydrase and lipid transport